MKHRVSLLLRMSLLMLLLGSGERFLAQTNAKIINKVEILGNRIYTDAQLLAHVKLKAGEKFDARQAARDLETLYWLGYFEKTGTQVITEAASENTINVYFKLSERPIIAEIQIKGLKDTPKTEILKLISRERIEVNMPYAYENLNEAGESITLYLAERGFPKADFVTYIDSVTINTVKITIVINEKPDDK